MAGCGSIGYAGHAGITRQPALTSGSATAKNTTYSDIAGCSVLFSFHVPVRRARHGGGSVTVPPSRTALKSTLSRPSFSSPEV